jgi:flagellar biosynthetic protein FlhB
MSDPAEKTLEPTPHRRQQARQEGQVARSHDLSSAVMLLAGLGALALLGGSLAGFLVNYCRNQLGGQPALAADSQWAVGQWNAILGSLAVRVAPILGLLCLAAVAINVLQGGFLLLPKRVALDFGRLSLWAGWRRVFSASSLARLGFGILKLATISAAAGALIYREVNSILGLAELAPPALAARAAGIVLSIALKLGGALLLLALVDYGYQWWRHERDLRMTPQELREELRNLEGNPQVAARRKQVQRDSRKTRNARSPLPPGEV